ncbi:MAG: acetyl-CoA carboxylase biotin carboxyl carrier protein, partial [Puniceicoccales bacterium]|nr:acetyl-CoA carboxylase biotin carboxyl carrier protein [Puniceicoccales bacterium]
NFSAVPNQSKLPHDYTIFAPVNDTKYEEPDTKDFSFIKSPMVGTFYSAPSPDAPNYVEVNSEVDSHTVVCIIEAMKVMNEIEADIKGIIADILVKNGQTVEYGQPLFKLKKS